MSLLAKAGGLRPLYIAVVSQNVDSSLRYRYAPLLPLARVTQLGGAGFRQSCIGTIT